MALLKLKKFTNNHTLGTLNTPANDEILVEAPTKARKAFLMNWEGEIVTDDGTVISRLKTGSQSGTSHYIYDAGSIPGCKVDDVTTPYNVNFPLPSIEIPIQDGYAVMTQTTSQTGGSSNPARVDMGGIIAFYE